MGTQPPPASDVFVTRQPIFDTRDRTFAYQLMFRSGMQNSFMPGPGSAQPTSSVISNGMLVGLGQLTDQKTAMVGLSSAALASDAGLALPAREVILEVAEPPEPDDAVVAACRKLKAAGYRLAVHSTPTGPHATPLAQLADFIKVDVQRLTPEQQEAFVQEHGPDRRLVASHLTSRKARAEAAGRGFDYFQGTFFTEPVAAREKSIPGFRLNYVRLLQELNKPEVNMRRLEEVVKQEASIAFRLLRRANSAMYGFRLETSALRHALVLLGEREIRQCATAWALADLARDQPAEIVVVSTLRARFCEMLALSSQLAGRSANLFLLGMFSLLDVILEQPMKAILGTLPLPPDIEDALLGNQNDARALLDCVLAYEIGDWERACERANVLGVAEWKIPTCYLEAVAWTREVFQWPA